MNEARACKSCGKEFVPNYPMRLYCSEQCYLAGQKKRKMHRPRANYLRVCAYCHTEYRSIMPQSKYCSSECHQQFYGVRNAIYKKYQFQQEKGDEELKKLEKLGKNYVLEGD